ncbi:MAG: CBS domain-containing protein [Solirubrobacterales bacterium]
MKIKDVMTRNVAAVDVADNVMKAAAIMKEHNVGSVPVCDSNRVAGIITDRDITLRTVAAGLDVKSQAVRDVMSTNPVVGQPEMDVTDAAKLMGDKQIRRLPIIEKNGLVGIVSLGDLALEPALKNETEEALSQISEQSTPEY